MDKFDIEILGLVQHDCTVSLNDLSEQIGLSATACWRRLQALESAGVIRGRVALLNPEALGIGVTVFVSIRTSQHSPKWLDRFKALVENIPEVLELYRMAGDTDYLMRVVVPDVKAYDSVYKRLIQIEGISDVSSAFAMEQMKSTTRLPLEYARSAP